MKRGTDHVWEVRRYVDNIAWYAHCKCGFEYCCSECKRNEDGALSFEQEIRYIYRYCPRCGARKKRQTNLVKLDKSRWE